MKAVHALACRNFATYLMCIIVGSGFLCIVGRQLLFLAYREVYLAGNASPSRRWNLESRV